MKLEEQELIIKTNADEEIQKAKELVNLLERAKELIQSLNCLKITNIKIDGAKVAEKIAPSISNALKNAGI